MNHNAAEILAKYLASQNLGTAPENIPAGSVGVWPVYINYEPPEGDLAICVYDTAAITDGRIQRTGVAPQHPGIQVLVRAIATGSAYDKAFSIHQALQSILRASVSLVDATYTINNAAEIKPPLRVGQPVGKNWMVYTVNCVLTINEFNQP